MKDKNTSVKKKKTIKRPNAPFYYLLAMIVAPFLKLYLKTTYDLSGTKDIKGPALVVCPHVSNIDFLLVAIALFPHRPTFVASQHFMVNPKTRWILKIMRVIPKKMFCPDIQTILSIMRAKEAGNIIVIFPEGRLTCFGHSLQVTDGTAELVKKLGINLYAIHEDGAYKSLPKWGKTGFRPGRIHIRTEKLADGEMLKSMSLDEINQILENAIYHDEDKLFTDIAYKSKAPAKGLDGILYQCPICKMEFTTVSDDHSIYCTSCGFKAELDETYTLSNGPFKKINDWYFWQEEQLDTSIPLESHAILGTIDKDGNMDRNAGEGQIYMDRDKISFKGTCYGEELEFTESTDIIKGLPASVSHHFDLYSKKVLYNFHLRPDPRHTIKWVIYLDKVTKEKTSSHNDMSPIK